MRIVTLLMIISAAIALGLTIGASSATAATCADFPNQAAAQRAANTRDANGNGIYCESLPCPCLGASGGPSGGSSGPSTSPKASGGGRCGVERWSVKTLQDPDASKVQRSPKTTTIAAIAALASLSTEGARRTPFETQVWKVPATLISAKVEGDSDIHLVIADPKTGTKMIAEIPLTSCAPRAPAWAKAGMTRARAALFACGRPGTRFMRYPSGSTTTISGVGFVDRMHGQTGVAPNGAELHPVVALTNVVCG